MTETKEFKKAYFRESERKADFKQAEFSVWCYRGALKDPKWKDQDFRMPISLVCFRIRS